MGSSWQTCGPMALRLGPGLKRGDVIVRVDGKDIHSSNDLFRMVQSGKRLTMEIVRDSRWQTVTVKPEPLYS